MVKFSSRSGSFHFNPPRPDLPGFGQHDGQNTLLETRLDLVFFDWSRQFQLPLKRSITPLAPNPGTLLTAAAFPSFPLHREHAAIGYEDFEIFEREAGQFRFDVKLLIVAPGVERGEWSSRELWARFLIHLIDQAERALHLVEQSEWRNTIQQHDSTSFLLVKIRLATSPQRPTISAEKDPANSQRSADRPTSVVSLLSNWQIIANAV
jgi:hypothetical protein